MAELFELELHGGAVERQYRRTCPEVDRLPWGTLDLSELTPQQVELARLGWTAASMQEYESTTVHSRVLQLMLRVRMPIDLTAMSTQFQREELTHAEVAAKVAMELGGGAPIAHQIAKEPRKRGRLEYQLTETALWAFAIGETYSHAMLTAGFTRAKDPLMRGVRQLFAKDEAAHGRFGWILLDTLLPEMNDVERTSLREVAGNAIEGLRKRALSLVGKPENFFGELSAIGPFAPEEYHALAIDTVDRQLAPRLGALDLI